MTKKITGEIVASQLATLPKTNKQFGFITVETSDSTNYRFKVGTSTKFDSIERGDTVEVQYDTLGSTDILTAEHIRKK